MKRKVFVLALTMIYILSGCNRSTESKLKTFEDSIITPSNGVYADLGNYMILLDEAKEGDYQGALKYLKEHLKTEIGACTVVGKKNSKGEVIIGRNLDMPPSLSPSFIVKTSFGKYKTIQLRFVSMEKYTYDEFKSSGYKDEDYINSIYYTCTDAMNEKGLYIEANVREANKGYQSSGTNPGKMEVFYNMVPAMVAQNCSTVQEALDFLRNDVNYVSRAYETTGITTDYAFYIGDAKGEYGLIEIANNEIVYLPYQNGQANYYLYPKYCGNDMHGSGHGRLAIALEGLEVPETKEDMYKQIGKAMWRDDTLYQHLTYIDDQGKPHFVDDKGNKIVDWRNEVYIDELINVYPEKKDEILEILGNKPARWFFDDENAPIILKYFKNYFIDNGGRDALLKYYAGDETEVRTKQNVHMTGIRFGINCAQKSMVMTFYERDDLTFFYNFD